MMRRGARLHRHHARRQLGEERNQLATREFARHNDLALRVDCVNLKHPLRQIEPNPRDSRQIPARLAHGRLPFRWGFDNDHLGTLMPFGAPSFAGGVLNENLQRLQRRYVSKRTGLARTQKALERRCAARPELRRLG